MKIPFIHNLDNKVFVDTYVDTRLMDFEQDKTEYITTIQDLDKSREHQTETRVNLINYMEYFPII